MLKRLLGLLAALEQQAPGILGLGLDPRKAVPLGLPSDRAENLVGPVESSRRQVDPGLQQPGAEPGLQVRRLAGEELVDVDVQLGREMLQGLPRWVPSACFDGAHIGMRVLGLRQLSLGHIPGQAEPPQPRPDHQRLLRPLPEG
jgi:hypothetical protein